ncbi:autotransporter outer membrane beta-barrel domain-containing protein [Nitratireductor sp. ZSWI3]|uniref:autotransporter outer membrane beta-barrel domain-containing protein n=1 Tax=Nitratireductor sp. ZSWI3 TaxID=2966359 RepID=UPI00215061E4|nr:autotransporter outer membrane beta-barrel domain-containing protein [Nitratireductor sp. ZSWI3]MCR4268525.1 autotransporter outer membrane beta-barrel domain-containing protein [Nitratireductor sp. ZSWI3]
MPFRQHLAALATWLAIAAAALFAAPAALAQDSYDMTAIFDRQSARAAASETRQLSILEERLNNTRELRGAGGNAAASLVRLRIKRGTGTDVHSKLLDTRKVMAPEKLRRTPRLAGWMGGEAELSEARSNDPRASGLSSKGLALGADLRISPRLLIGNAVGLAYDRSPLSTDLTYEARTLTTTLYGTIFTTPQTYLDFALGGARSDFSGRAMTGERPPAAAGDRVFAMLRASRAVDVGGRDGQTLKLRGYGQGTVSRTRFDGATDGCGTEAAKVSLGLRGETKRATQRGHVRPHAGVEWSLTRTQTEHPGATLDDRHRLDRQARFAATAGFDWKVNPHATVKANYGLSAGAASGSPEQTLKARFTLRF